MTLHALSRLTVLSALALGALTANAADASITVTGSLATEQSAWQSFASGLSKELPFSWSDIKTSSGFSQGGNAQTLSQHSNDLAAMATQKRNPTDASEDGQTSGTTGSPIKLSDLGLGKSGESPLLPNRTEHGDDHHKPVSEVPEPSTWVMTLLGMFAVVLVARRRAH